MLKELRYPFEDGTFRKGASFFGVWGMTNQHIRVLIEQVKKGSVLTKAEQLQVLSALLRANRRIIAARKLGYESPTAAADNVAIFPEVAAKVSSA